MELFLLLTYLGLKNLFCKVFPISTNHYKTNFGKGNGIIQTGNRLNQTGNGIIAPTGCLIETDQKYWLITQARINFRGQTICHFFTDIRAFWYLV